MIKWNDFYKNIMKIEIINNIKKWCENNDVQFEPYARDKETNELKCTCCYYGDINTEKEYLSLKIGDNGSFNKTDQVENKCDVEDCTCNNGNGKNGCGYFEEDINKDIWDMISEYEKEIDNNPFISHNLSDKKLEKFCNKFGYEKPEINTCILME